MRRLVERARSIDPVHNAKRALLIGLNDEADAVPSRHRRIAAQGLEQIERQIEPLGFLGVDVDADIERAGEDREALEARIKLAHHAPALARGHSADGAPRA